MDLPNDVATNVFQVVSYRNHNNLLAKLNSAEENVTNIFWSQWSQAAVQTRSSGHTPDGLVHDLRNNHAHALLDFGSQDIRLFEFSTSRRNEFDEMIRSRGFSETSRGFLENADPEMTTNPSGETNILYKGAMLALSASLCHRFVSEISEQWMVLGVATCIDITGPLTSMIKFEAKWDVAGQLSVSPVCSQAEKLCQVATAATNDLPVGTPLLLSPSGIRTQYRGRLHKVSSDAIESSKSRCMRLLDRQGHSVSLGSEWILVEVDVNRSKLVTVWPAEYAFYKHEGKLQDSVVDTSEDTDPIARAETWFLGRAARAAVNSAPSEAEIQPQQQQLLQRDNYETPSEVASPAFREIIAPQDISGIYPTPPDGLISQTPASNVQQEASPKFAASGHHDASNADLFEDMDMDLVGEADFSFFDEPEIVEETSVLPISDDNASLSDHPADVPDQTHKHAETPNAGSEEVVLESHPSQMDDSAPQQLEEIHEQEQVNSRGSFNPLALTNLDFAGKYGHKGRFGYSPLEATGQEKQEIFQFGAQLNSTESQDSDDEETSSTTLNIGYDIDEDASIEKEEAIATPESSMDNDDAVKLGRAPSEIFYPTVDPGGVAAFFHSPGYRETARMAGNHSSFIPIAQLVADQCPPLSSLSPPNCPQSLRPALLDCLPLAKNRHLEDLADEINRVKSTEMGIQRVGAKMNISSSAIPFWEELGLGPRSGSKNVNAFCFFPRKEGFVTAAKTFLEMMKGAYQTCNLGKHILDDAEAPFPYSLVPVQDDKKPFDWDTTSKFTAYMTTRRLTGGNTVIYMVNTGDEEQIPEMCGQFWLIFKAYRSFLDKYDLRNPNDLVLQIVPASMVFSSHQLTIPSLTDYKRIAFQVYDRCGPVERDLRSPFLCAPAICLVESTSVVNFKLAADPVDTGDSLHLAYKWEYQWLTAAWTNETGVIQWYAAYWLSEDEDIRTSFLQVATAMLETTRDILKSQGASYRVHVVKDGSYEDYELEALTNPDLRITLSEIDPPSTFLLPQKDIPLLDSLTSPEATANVGASPDFPAQISTPGGTVSYDENDPEARLIDIADETWTVTVESPMREVNSQSSPLSTGYLLKRAGTRNENGLLSLQVHIVRDTAPQKGRTQELLGMYSSLASLARARGVIDPVQGILPIHVATARKGHAVLCRTMRLML